MKMSDVVAILQIGFSGFAFLLAGMSYKLLRAEAEQQGPGRRAILGSIHRYTNYTLAIAMVALLASISEKWLTSFFEYQNAALRQQQASTASEALNCRGALDRLLNAETKVNPEYSALLRAIQEASANCSNTLEMIGRHD